MPETEMPANTATAPRRGYKRQGPSPPGVSATPVSPLYAAGRASGNSARRVVRQRPGCLIQHYSRLPEQRICGALKCTDHRTNAPPLDQPALAAGFPLRARLAHHTVELMRTADRDQGTELSELTGADLPGDYGCSLRHALILRCASPRHKG